MCKKAVANNVQIFISLCDSCVPNRKSKSMKSHKSNITKTPLLLLPTSLDWPASNMHYSDIHWNQSKLGEHIKINLHFSNLYIMRTIYTRLLEGT